MPSRPTTAQQRADAARLKSMFIAWQNNQRHAGNKVSQESAAAQLGIGQSALTQRLNGTMAMNAEFAAAIGRLINAPVRNFSPALAAEIDAMLPTVDAAPPAAMSPIASRLIASIEQFESDGSYDGSLSHSEIQEAIEMYLAGRSKNVVHIPQLDVRAAMGVGVDLQEHVDVVRMVRVNLPDLRRQVASFSAPENLRILTGYGDSMMPTFSNGDPLLIDIGVADITVDGIYVLEKDDQLFVKRMQRRITDGTLIMKSDNEKYDPEYITDVDRSKFAVRGRALGVWNFAKL